MKESANKDTLFCACTALEFLSW